MDSVDVNSSAFRIHDNNSGLNSIFVYSYTHENRLSISETHSHMSLPVTFKGDQQSAVTEDSEYDDEDIPLN